MLNEKIMLEFSKINKEKSYLILKEIGFVNENLVYTTEKNNKNKIVKNEWVFPAIKKYEVHDILDNNLNLETYLMNRIFCYELKKGSEITFEFFKKYQKISRLKDLINYVDKLKIDEEIDKLEEVNNSCFYEDKYSEHYVKNNKIYFH